MDLGNISLAEATERIAHGDLSSVDYTRRLLDRIAERAELNAFITVDDDALLGEARRADRARARGGPLGPLHGVPIAVKDNIDTADLPTTGGTPALRRHRPLRDAEVVRRLRQAGALVLGKTNLHELAYGLTGDNGAFGAVANPHRTDRIAGGSSSGSAAAVGARLAAAALGTDTGGSVRVPASLCGVAGLRPSTGRYPQQGVILVSGTRDTVGPLARSVADLALLDVALTGTAAGQPQAGVDALRLGAIRRPFWDGLAPDLAAVLERRLGELAAQGATIVDLEAPARLDDLIVKAGLAIAFHETTVELPRYLAASGEAQTPAQVVHQCGTDDVKAILTGLLGPGAVTLEDYRAAIAVHRPALTEAFRTLFAAHRLDALVWPTTPLTAAPLGTQEVMLGGAPISAFLAYTRTTNPGSIIGLPGVTLPAGLDDAGLPIGLALDALPGQDRRLLAIARASEQAFAPLP